MWSQDKYVKSLEAEVEKLKNDVAVLARMNAQQMTGNVTLMLENNNLKNEVAELKQTMSTMVTQKEADTMAACQSYVMGD